MLQTASLAGDAGVDGGSAKGLTGRWRIVEMDNEGDQVSGRGWAALTEDGGLTGHLFFHLGDDSGLRATPFEIGTGAGR